MRKLLFLLLFIPNLALAQGIIPGGSGGGAPSGAAGGVLSGTYPNPGFAASPTFVTPILGVATATSVNGIGLTGTGTFTGTSSTSLGRGQYLGEASTGAATAGNIGEYIESVVSAGSAVSLTTTTALNLSAGITLTAGDWDVTCEGFFNPAATSTVVYAEISISTTTGVRNNTSGNFIAVAYAAGTVPANDFGATAGPTRFSVAGSTPVFCVGFSVFGSTNKLYGVLRARRMR